jgi:hypothetical protein
MLNRRALIALILTVAIIAVAFLGLEWAVAGSESTVGWLLSW